LFAVGSFLCATQKLDSIVWTGRQFLYVQNTANTVWSAPPAGRPLHKFATMPRLVEETRCILSPGSHGFSAGVIFCHSPDNKIYEISPDGANKTVFASLPAPFPPAADGHWHSTAWAALATGCSRRPGALAASSRPGAWCTRSTLSATCSGSEATPGRGAPMSS
jgi:hypothetical protein